MCAREADAPIKSAAWPEHTDDYDNITEKGRKNAQNGPQRGQKGYENGPFWCKNGPFWVHIWGQYTVIVEPGRINTRSRRHPGGGQYTVTVPPGRWSIHRHGDAGRFVNRPSRWCLRGSCCRSSGRPPRSAARIRGRPGCPACSRSPVSASFHCWFYTAPSGTVCRP